ncbi:MAG: C69 family dipeptidase [Ignavibacteriaceae bacterium]|nr:C69 family dipeptidase [Ignavibacteriaceae bacterium]
MTSNKKKYLIAAFLTAFSFYFVSPAALTPTNQECFMVLVGKKATKTGKVMLAHNNDLTGKEASFVEIIPPNYDSGQVLIKYSTGASITLYARTYRILIQRIEEGFAEGDAVAINEFGVAIAGGVALGSDRNQKAKRIAPLVPNGLPGGIRYDILARSKTARECVMMLGDAYSEYGVSYPSGVGIADSSEIWYIECGGGKQWAAVRVPDSCYWVQANGYRIGIIDTSDKEYFLTSPGLLEFCVETGLWNPEETYFNFAKVFGDGRTKENGGLEYDRLRVWRGLNLLSPSLGLKSNDENLPTYPVPDNLITESDLFAVLRDFYAGTDYDRSNKYPMDESIRSIATWRGVHSSVIVITPSQPIESAAILWSGIGSSFVTGFTPIPFGVSQIPSKYNSANEESAFYMFFQLAKTSSSDWERIKSIRNSFAEDESDLLEQINRLIEEKNLYKINVKRLNSFTEYAAKKILDKVNQWLEK